MSDAARNNTNRQIEAIKAELKARAIRVHEGMEKTAVQGAAMIEATAKKLMTEAEVDVSKSYGRRKHHPSIPGSAPAVDSGTMRRSVTHDAVKKDGVFIARVGSVLKEPPYPSYLETGTSDMEARPWLQPAVDQNREKIKANFRKAGRGAEISLDVTGGEDA